MLKGMLVQGLLCNEHALGRPRGPAVLRAAGTSGGVRSKSGVPRGAMREHTVWCSRVDRCMDRCHDEILRRRALGGLHGVVRL